MTTINAGNTLVNQYAPPFVISDSVTTNWQLRYNANILAFEAFDPSENVIAAGFDTIESQIFNDVTNQQVFVLPWAVATEASLYITMNGMKIHTDSYGISTDTDSNTTTVTLESPYVGPNDFEFIGLQTTGGASIEITTATADGVDDTVDLNWLAPSEQSLLISLDGIKQDTTAYSIASNATFTATTVTFSEAPSLSLTTISSIGASGSGYTNTDTVTVIGGTGTSAATIDIDTVGGGGDVLTASLVEGGVYSVVPTNPVSVTGRTVLAQDETNFDGGASNGTWVAGTAYNDGDTILLNDGTVVTIAAGNGAGPVTVFDITTATPAPTVYIADVLTQVSTSGGGSGFTLTLDANNILGGATFNLTSAGQAIEIVGITTSGETPASPVVVTTVGGTYSLFRNKRVSGETQYLDFYGLAAGANITITPNAADPDDAFYTIAADQIALTQATGGTSLFDSSDPVAGGFRTITAGDRILLSVNGTSPDEIITIAHNLGHRNVLQDTQADPYVQIATDRLIGVTLINTGTQGITLLDATTLTAGDTITVKNQTTFTDAITLTPTAGLINGAATYVINTAYGYVTLYSDGINYYIIAEG